MGTSRDAAADGERVRDRGRGKSKHSEAARVPLTERVIAALPGWHPLWTISWGLVILVRPVVAAAMMVATGQPTGDASRVIEQHLPHSAALAFVVVLALAGSRRLARDAAAAWRDVDRIALASRKPVHGSIRGVGQVVGPLVITGAIVVARAASPMVPSSPAANAVDTLFLVAIAVPIATWIWTFGAVLISIEAFGRRPLPIELFPLDRGLGVLSIGRVPFNSFWLFALATVTYFTVVANDAVEQILGGGAFLVVLVALVASLWRLHVQMVTAKNRHLDRARQFLEEAAEPYQRNPSLDALHAQADRIAAAVALEKRVEEILEWPIDQRIVTRTVLIATGVITFLIARVVASQFGIA